ncbi:MAG: rRNA maturation RNase YbeY [Acidobacteria bacterium]|nr:rRNA maturation RNase YbeY [Acidobacteriota bacterium]
MIEIVNRQRRRELDIEHWEMFARRALDKIGVEKDAGATIAFVSDRAMRALNKKFRGRAMTTDVLSFPSEQAEWEKSEGESLGDIVISVERAEAQAAGHELDFTGEVAQLILHGLLHLHGHDHETDDGEMNALEVSLRRRLGI